MMDSDDHQGADESQPLQRTIQTPGGRGWISLRQFATLMEKDYHTVLRWKTQKRFRFIKIGTVRILEDEVRYILENGLRPPQYPADSDKP